MSEPRRARLADPLAQLLAIVVAALFALQIAPQHGPFVLPAVLIGFAVCWPPAVPWRPLRVLAVLRVQLPFAAAWLGFLIGYLHLAHALGHSVPVQPQLARLAEHGLAGDGAWPLVLGIVVVAPLVEEVLFRGYLFTALDRLLPRPATHLLTAVLFGLAHGIEYALPIGVLALLFGWLRARHGALGPAVIAHTVHNGLTVGVVLCWPGALEAIYP